MQDAVQTINQNQTPDQTVFILTLEKNWQWLEVQQSPRQLTPNRVRGSLDAKLQQNELLNQSIRTHQCLEQHYIPIEVIVYRPGKYGYIRYAIFGVHGR